MKKLLYSILGCATLFAVGTATGREALTQMASHVIQRAPEDGDTYVRVNQVVDLEVKYDAMSDKVKMTFTTPRSASWLPVTWDDYEFETIDRICIYRNEGQYYSESSRVLLKELTDVPKGLDMEWEEEAPEHGKTYYYMVIPSIGEREGGTSGQSVVVGRQIDHAPVFDLIAGENGAREVTINIVAPSTSDGNTMPLEGTLIDKIEITRQDASDYYGTGTVIKEYTDVEPGAELQYVDTDEALELGHTYKYRLVLYYDGSVVRPWQNNEDILVGPDMPKAVESVTAEVLPDGVSVKVAWTPFEGTGVKGGWVDPETLRYNVYRNNVNDYNESILVAEGLTDTEFVDTTIAMEGTYKYVVYTCAGSVESRSYSSDEVVAGPPASMPFLESWSDYRPKYPTWEKTYSWSNTSSMSYYIYDPEFKEIKFEPSDKDGGMMAFQPYSYTSPEGTVESVTSGRISMLGAINPILSFDYLDIDPALSDNTFKVYISRDGGEFELLPGIDTELLPGLNTWHNFTVSLIDYADETDFIRVKFEVTVGSLVGKSAIDNVQVREMMPVDLVVNSVNAVNKFYPGAQFNVSVSVSNTGDNFSEPFAAMLYIGDKELGYTECEGLNGFETRTISVPVTIPEDVDGGAQDITVEIFAGYEASTDNNTGAFAVEVVELPAVSEFVYSDGVISWEAVAELPFNDGLIDVEEDFADYAHLAADGFGAWTVIDGDGLATYSFNAGNFPLTRQPLGGVIVNPEAIEAEFRPVTGDQCFLFVTATSYSDSDDWLISPSLSGGAQTVSFKVLTTTSYDSEKFEVMYSTTDNNPESFTSIVKYEDSFKSYNEWMEITAELPEGTKYFAIHYYSYYASGLAIDDIRFVAGSGLDTPETAHMGYNVYCDGEKVNDELITDTHYILADDAPAGEYTVKAAYNNAEARPSASQRISTVGVAGVAAALQGVQVEGNTVVIDGEGSYTVADVAGRVVTTGHGCARVVLPAGTYIVATESATLKVAVK